MHRTVVIGEKNPKPFHSMTALDAGICMDYAHGIDPHRGARWEDAFDQKARELGYQFAPKLKCDCPPGGPHDQHCGFVKPA